MITPFKVTIEQEILDDLRNRISQTRWPEEQADSSWSNGTSLGYLRELADHWLNRFDWRKIEAEINALPNFIADIDGYKIHFIHVKGRGKKNMPLIITHGWPGSFIEMLKLIPLLTGDPEFSFDLVIPSIIGFGFSQKVTEPGCSSLFVSGLWSKLMAGLGYAQYGVQGGDIGAGIGAWLALKHPSQVLGLHLNFITGSYQPYIKTGETLSEEVISFQKYRKQWSDREGAYSHLHATKPLTQAYGLNDSPVGLCAWIIEKFAGWGDDAGNPDNSFSKDELLANVTLYWVTSTIYTSMLIYKENSRQPLAFGENDFVHVPVAFARFPGELPTPPKSYIEKGFNIVRWTEMPAGGRFAAMEQPQLLANDIRDFFRGISY